jgi:hypothetical protein
MAFFQRFFGIILFRPTTYRFVASNSSLMIESSLTVFFAAFLSSVLYTWFNGFGIQAILRIIGPIVAWLFIGLLCTLIANTFFKVKIQAPSVLRTTGYARVFLLLALFTIILYPSNFYAPIATGLGTSVSIIASILAIRESCNVSTWQAVAIFSLSFFIFMIFTIPVLIVLGLR